MLDGENSNGSCLIPTKRYTRVGGVLGEAREREGWISPPAHGPHRSPLPLSLYSNKYIQLFQVMYSLSSQWQCAQELARLILER